MKIYIYSLYDRKTGELLAKGTAKELTRQHWYNSADSVYHAYRTQQERADDRHGCSNCRIEREALEKPKKHRRKRRRQRSRSRRRSRASRTRRRCSGMCTRCWRTTPKPGGADGRS